MYSNYKVYASKKLNRLTSDKVESSKLYGLEANYTVMCIKVVVVENEWSDRIARGSHLK